MQLQNQIIFRKETSNNVSLLVSQGRLKRKKEEKRRVGIKIDEW